MGQCIRLTVGGWGMQHYDFIKVSEFLLGRHLQYFSRYCRAGFGIGQSVMMVLQVISAACGYYVKRVAPLGPAAARRYAGAVELVVGIVHLIDAEHGLLAAFVKRLVVGHQGQTLYQRLYLPPHFRKNRGAGGVGGAKSVNLAAPIAVVLGFWLYE